MHPGVYPPRDDPSPRPPESAAESSSDRSSSRFREIIPDSAGDSHIRSEAADRAGSPPSRRRAASSDSSRRQSGNRLSTAAEDRFSETPRISATHESPSRSPHETGRVKRGQSRRERQAARPSRRN